MPMFNANILPDVTGRVLGAADKQWDGFFRNIVLTGTLSGSGLTSSDVTNPVPDVDSVNVQSDPGTGMLLRFRISNPSAGAVQFQFKNGQILLGGITAPDSPSVGISFLSNAGEGTGTAAFNIYQRGSIANSAMNIDIMGRINSYADNYTTYAFQIAKLGDANAIFIIDSSGHLLWGAGGNNGLDVNLFRNAAASIVFGDGSGGYSTVVAARFQSQIATGNSPLIVASSTLVPNLNADFLDSADWTAPPAIGSVTPGDVHAALLTASSQVQSTLNDGVTPPFSVLSAVPVATLRVKFASDLTIENHLLADGSGAKHKRVNIASLDAGAETNVTVTWTTPFADTSYTPVVSIFDAGTAGGVQAGLRIKRITQQDAAHISVQVINDDSSAHAGGVLLAHAFRG
jgi:hypothetical protein